MAGKKPGQSEPTEPQFSEQAEVTEQEQAQGQEPVASEEGATDSGPYFRYTGPATRREISRAEFEQAGVLDQDGLVFDSSNGMRVPADSVNEAARQRLAAEPDIEYVDAED